MSKLLVFGIAILVGIIINFSVLYAMILNLRSEVANLRAAVAELPVDSSKKVLTPTMIPENTLMSSPSASCPQCREDIDEIKKILLQITPAGKSFTSQPVVNAVQAKEFFIPLGSGKTKANDWEDIPGMSATIDSRNYTKIKSVVFEISLRIPTANGTVSARLFDKTDQHPVWFSEVNSEGSVAILKQSSNLTLDPGEKTYQVQMKNTLRSESIADSARIKIVLQ